MNYIQLKRAVRSNRITKKFADKAYLLLTGQLREERHCKSGCTPYYIIRPPRAKVGILGLYLDVVCKTMYALEKGYKPVIDYENYGTVYLGGEFRGNKNVWEWYFDQPFHHSLKNAYEGDYILSPMAGRFKQAELLNGNLDILEKYINTAKKLALSRDIYIYIYEASEKIHFCGGKSILGVFCRGTDYTQYKPVGHPVQPSRADLIEMAAQKMAEWGCDRIFLTTEESESVQAFQNAFPGKVLTVKQDLVENFSIDKGLLIEEYKTANGSTPYASGLGYLASVVLLSKCDCFLGAIAGGSAGALVMNGLQYREKEIINLGVYS